MTTQRRLLSLLAFAALFAALLCGSLAQDSGCVAPPPLTAADTVEVAVLVFGQDPAQPRGEWPDFMQQSAFGPPMVTVPSSANLGFVLYNSYYQGLHMWSEPMRQRARPNLPFPGGGGTDIQLRYINLASADWSVPEGFGSSMGQVAAEHLAADGSLKAGSMLYNLTDDALYADFGASSPFTFIIIPPYLPDAVTIALANRVEELQNKILLHPFGGSQEPYVCADPQLVTKYGAHTGIGTPDCTVRGKLPGQRRFSIMFNMLPDAALAALSAMDVWHVSGVKSVGIFVPGPSAGETFPFWAGQATVESAENINMDAMLFQTVVDCSGSPCTHRWPDGKTSMDVAREIKNNDIDVTVMVGGVASASAALFSELLTAFREIDYTPKNMYFAGGMETPLGARQPLKDSLDFASLTLPWVPQLRGPNFRSINSPINFELYSAVPGGADSPQVWQQAFSNYNNPGAVQPVLGILGYACLNVMQKMVELSRSKHVPTLLATASGMSVPSPYGLINFDPAGRWSTKTQVLQQRGRLADGANGAYRLKVAYPFNIGSPIEYPMPTWRERVAADPNGYNEFNDGNKVYDNAIIGVNTVLLALALVVLLLVVFFRNTSVIRSSTPWFCMLNVLGVMLMLLANYLTLTTVNDAMCAGQVWLLTLGFSITFGSLFFKTFRIWRIFGRQKLRVLKMKDTELLLYLAALLAVDIVINAVWQGGYGMPARIVVPDPYRPAFNYSECAYSDETIGFLYAHVAVKGALLFCGILLGYAVRNTPSAFNEATFIALSIYNVSLTSAFVIPILTSGLGGRVTVLSIRAYAVMFISATTLAILFVPKFMKIFSKDRVNGLGADTTEGGGNQTYIGDDDNSSMQLKGGSSGVQLTGNGGVKRGHTHSMGLGNSSGAAANSATPSKKKPAPISTAPSGAGTTASGNSTPTIPLRSMGSSTPVPAGRAYVVMMDSGEADSGAPSSQPDTELHSSVPDSEQVSSMLPGAAEGQ